MPVTTRMIGGVVLGLALSPVTPAKAGVQVIGHDDSGKSEEQPLRPPQQM